MPDSTGDASDAAFRATHEKWMAAADSYRAEWLRIMNKTAPNADRLHELMAELDAAHKAVLAEHRTPS